MAQITKDLLFSREDNEAIRRDALALIDQINAQLTTLTTADATTATALSDINAAIADINVAIVTINGRLTAGGL